MFTLGESGNLNTTFDAQSTPLSFYLSSASDDGNRFKFLTEIALIFALVSKSGSASPD